MGWKEKMWYWNIIMNETAKLMSVKVHLRLDEAVVPAFDNQIRIIL